MLGNKLKALRETKSWSQAHLADAARLNIRTVQRIEAGEPASYETLLSLAAALSIDVAELEPAEASARAAAHGLSRSRVGLAVLLVSPAVLFIVVNLLRSIAGMNGSFDALADAGAKLVSFGVFNLVSPVIFLGGPAIALMLCLPALIRVRTNKVGRGILSINGLELRAHRTALAIAAVAVLSAATLFAYAALELLHSQAP